MKLMNVLWVKCVLKIHQIVFLNAWTYIHQLMVNKLLTLDSARVDRQTIQIQPLIIPKFAQARVLFFMSQATFIHPTSALLMITFIANTETDKDTF